MDLPLFLSALLLVVAAGVGCVMLYRRRRNVPSLLILNHHVDVVEPSIHTLEKPPSVPPMPPTTTSQPVHPGPTRDKG